MAQELLRIEGLNAWYGAAQILFGVGLAVRRGVELALEAAMEEGDLGPFDRLLAAVRAPFEERPAFAAYAEPAPAAVTAAYRTFCGT